MKTYKIYKNEKQKVFAVTDGFSFTAFSVGIVISIMGSVILFAYGFKYYVTPLIGLLIWLLFRKAWQEALRIFSFVLSLDILVCLFVTIFNVIRGNDVMLYWDYISSLVCLVMFIIYSFKANEKIESEFIERGYQFIDNIKAETAAAAIAQASK